MISVSVPTDSPTADDHPELALNGWPFCRLLALGLVLPEVASRLPDLGQLPLIAFCLEGHPAAASPAGFAELAMSRHTGLLWPHGAEDSASRWRERWERFGTQRLHHPRAWLWIADTAHASANPSWEQWRLEARRALHGDLPRSWRGVLAPGLHTAVDAFRQGRRLSYDDAALQVLELLNEVRCVRIETRELARLIARALWGRGLAGGEPQLGDWFAQVEQSQRLFTHADVAAVLAGEVER